MTKSWHWISLLAFQLFIATVIAPEPTTVWESNNNQRDERDATISISLQDDPFQRNSGTNVWQVMLGIASMEVNDPIVSQTTSLKLPKVSNVSVTPITSRYTTGTVLTISSIVTDKSGAGITNVYFYTSPEYAICSDSSPFLASLTSGNQYYGIWSYSCKVASAAINTNYTIQAQAGDWNGNYNWGASTKSFQIRWTPNNLVATKAPVIKSVTFSPKVLRAGDTLTMTAYVKEIGMYGKINSSYVLFSFLPTTASSVCMQSMLVGRLTSGSSTSGNYTGKQNVSHPLPSNAITSEGMGSYSPFPTLIATLSTSFFTSFPHIVLAVLFAFS